MIEPGQTLDELPTPCLVVDVDRLERNVRREQDAIAANSVRFRPHAKTHKTAEIAALQLAAGAAGLAVAKVAEAEVFVAAGAVDIAVAYPVFGTEKWQRLAELGRGARVTTNVDNEAAAHGLSRAAVSASVTLLVQIEIDSGLHRCGFAPDDIEDVARLARLVDELPGLELDGITTHRSVAFEGADVLTPDEAGRDEGRLLVDLAAGLRVAGISVREVTCGSTPTARAAAAVPGVTEVRAGTYVFNDWMQVANGSATFEDCALTILTTVVSARIPGRATVDAGSKTLSGDARRPDAGVATGLDVDAIVDRLSEEHGMVRLGPRVELGPGDRIRLVPQHVCTCVNLADELVAVRGGTVEAVWRVAARGRRT